MIFEPLSVAGAYLITPQKRSDERGYFARVFCCDELAAQGLCTDYCQANTALSPRAGTLRGLHFQRAPHAEVKLVRCTRGRVFDVVLDLRRDSPTYLRWHGAELSADNAAMLYAPEGTAHGYLTLSDDTELLYMTSAMYAPEAGALRRPSLQHPLAARHHAGVGGRSRLACLPRGRFDRPHTIGVIHDHR
jgi:dTDP-4-dehydrorhamnose 3,5-epimerase